MHMAQQRFIKPYSPALLLVVNRYRCPVLWDAAGLIEESDAQFRDTYIMNMYQACLQLTSQLHLCVFCVLEGC